MKKFTLICLVPLLLISFEAFAESEVSLSSGLSYENPEIRSIESGDVLLLHSGGIARLPLNELTDEDRKLIGLSPTVEIARLDFSYLVKSLRESALTSQEPYRVHLQELERAAMAKGEVDEVVEIRQELSGLPSLKPMEEIQSPSLKEARKANLKRAVGSQSDLLKFLETGLINYETALQTLVGSLRESGQVTEEALVRDEIAKVTEMKEAPKSALVSLNIVPAILSLDFDRSSGRIVILPLNQEALSEVEPASFSALERADRSDVVSLSRTPFPKVAGILSTGDIAYWDNDSSTTQFLHGNHTACTQYPGLPLIGLDRDGTLNFSSESDAQTLAELTDLNGIIELSATSGLVVLVSVDGSVTVAGPRQDHPNALLLNGMKNVRSVGFAGLAFANVLRRNGTVFRLKNGELMGPLETRPIVRMCSDGIGMDDSGLLVSLGATRQSFISDIGPNPIQTFREQRLNCAISESGDFICRLLDENGEFQSLESVESGLNGALSFAPIYGPRGAIWLSAILPRGEVYRSGLWEVGKLIETRRLTGQGVR